MSARERPILMSAPVVRALLAGTKTQTRRIVKHHITGPNPPGGFYDWHDKRTGAWVGAHGGNLKFNKTNAAVLCPYGGPGDRLWVRETWAAAHNTDHLKPSEIDCESRIHYAATENLGGLLKRPSIFIPRWASRIALEVTGVRVERLQSISSADAIKEGIEACPHGGEWRDYLNPTRDMLTPRNSYRSLWESINGPGSWDANPFVWVVEFRRI